MHITSDESNINPFKSKNIRHKIMDIKDIIITYTHLILKLL